MADPAMHADEVVDMTAMLRRLARSTMGKRLLEVALTNDLRLTYASRLRLWYPGRGVAGAQYCTGRSLIRVGRGHPADVQIALLAHELQHFCDEVLGWGLGWSIDSEVRAEQSAGLVITELGLHAGSHALDGGGALRARPAIATSLRTRRMYADYAAESPRMDGRLHPLATNEELQPGPRAQALRTPAARVLVAGPATSPEPGPTDTAWCPVPHGALQSACVQQLRTLIRS